MANEEQLQILLQGVSVWNAWRQEHTEIEVDLIGADLSRINHSGADLRRANLHRANLSGADFGDVLLSGANFREANLSKANLSWANLRRRDFVGTDLSGANLSWANLSWANLSRADLSKANLSGASLTGANFSGASLREASLSRVDLSSQNLTGLDLTGVDFCQTNFIDANLNGATLTDSWLWETQRGGWSIRGVICEAAYWDRNRQKRETYGLGEFERLYSDRTKIVLHYKGGMSPIEIATLPALIQRIEATHPGCVLRLQSVQEAPGGATVTLVVHEEGGRTPTELQTLKADIEIVSQRAIRAQRAWLEERGRREQIEIELQIVYDNIMPRLMGRTMEKLPSTQINISGGTIYGNVVGDVSGTNAQVNYTYSDLAAIEALVNEISAHSTALPLTSAERTQFEEKLTAIQEQLAAQTPNHSLMREALHSVRHILEAGVAHFLVGQWLPLLHKLG